jgi:hypothetical protein
LKSSSPHQKAQEKVCPPIAMKIQCWIWENILQAISTCS